MAESIEIPDCHYPKEPILVSPITPTPTHTLYLSNLDDQKFLRFTSKYLYVFRKSIAVETLAASLSRVLVEYYPLAGRVRAGAGNDGEKLEVDCNGEGALLVEAHVDLTADRFLQGGRKPNRSWRKLLYRVEEQSFVDTPPLVIQVTRLSCGGMILCTAINHCVCDAIAAAQFLQAWGLFTSKPDAHLPMNAFHDRSILKPREPLRIEFSHPEFSSPPPQENLSDFILSQPLAPVSVTFTGAQVLRLKKQCEPSVKCTSFEVLAWHIWRSWIKALEPPPSLRTKLLFSMSVRKKLEPELPNGYFGNGFIMACAETSVEELISSNSNCAIFKSLQEAKNRVDDGYVRSMIDLLEERRVKPDMSSTLVISPLTKVGFEELDFGEGKPLHMGYLVSEIYCLLLPVVGDLNAFTMLMSVPQGIAERFHQYCTEDLDDAKNVDAEN
ncbi:hypothetical protein Cni_G17769 [Canna indica]|uniref:Omega-hydroxypalmitate O-feruloyl transferase n=1 Tax=Canna indica TaxID=4628 RepID=A0AAQ3QGX0_9LILI|nr:hypothetical protein Cni_G17769 [Canna indica]